MNSVKHAIGYRVALWVLPFVVSLLIFPTVTVGMGYIVENKITS